MKKISSILIILTFAVVCFMPTGVVQAWAQLDDSIYNPLQANQPQVNYNTGAVLIYRGWNSTLGYVTEMIKAIPHINIINLTGQTLSFTEATGIFSTNANIVGQVSLMREITQPGTPNQFAYSFDLKGTSSNGYIGSADNNPVPGPTGDGGTTHGDGDWNNSLNGLKTASDLQMQVGSSKFGLHVDWGSNYNGWEVGNANLVTMSLRDVNKNPNNSLVSGGYAQYVVNNGVINRGMVYLTGYSDSRGNPYEVFLIAGDRTAITFLVKYASE